MKSPILALTTGLLMLTAGVCSATEVEPAAGAGQSPPTRSAKPTTQSTNPAEWLQRAAIAYDNKDYAAVEAACLELVRLRPHIGEYGYLLAKSYALQNKRREGYDRLIKLSEQGLFFDLSADPDLASLRGYPVYDHVVGKFEQNAGPLGAAETAVTIGHRDLLIDSLAWDADGGQLLAGSIREGKVARVGDDGKLETLVAANDDNGLLAVLDTVIDQQRGWLWVATGGVPQFKAIKPDALGRTGVFKFDLQTGKLIKRYLLLPDGKPHLLANLALGPNGDLYVADAKSPTIYQIDRSSDQLALFLIAPGLTSLRGMVVDPAGSSLFIADYEQGLYRLALETGKLYQFGIETPVNFGGISSLLWYKDSLIAIQNGNEPARVMRVALDPSGTRVAHAQPLLVGLEAFSAPSVGVQVGQQLYLLAANESHMYHPLSGKLLDGAQPTDPIVLRADMEYGWMPQLNQRPGALKE